MAWQRQGAGQTVLLCAAPRLPVVGRSRLATGLDGQKGVASKVFKA